MSHANLYFMLSIKFMFMFTESLKMFIQEKSFEQGYLEGFASKTKYCHEKMVSDLAILYIKMSSIEAVRASSELKTSTMDKIGLFGTIPLILNMQQCSIIF